MLSRYVLVSNDDDHEPACCGYSTSDVAKNLQRCLVGPLRVVDDKCPARLEPREEFCGKRYGVSGLEGGTELRLTRDHRSEWLERPRRQPVVAGSVQNL